MKTIGDIDDARLGKAIKALLHRIELNGGHANIVRSSSKPYPVAGVEVEPLPQNWTLTVHSSGPNPYMPGGAESASLSHADLLEVFEQTEQALRP